MSLEFSALHLIINEKSPSADILKLVFSVPEDRYSDGDTHYLINKENLNDEYFWFEARYGNLFPYSSTVYNTKNNIEENNPRKTEQVETCKQIFALYSVKYNIFYISNIKKKNFIEKYLGYKLKTTVNLKFFFQNVDDFIKRIKSIEKVKFVAKKNLFTSRSTIMNIFPSPNDIYGLGMPEDFTLEANFSHAHLTDSFKAKLREMVGWKNSNEAHSLICIGRDDKNFENIFNAQAFIQKISIEENKNMEGIYTTEKVKSSLINMIREKNEKNS